MESNYELIANLKKEVKEELKVNLTKQQLAIYIFLTKD